MSWDVFVQDFPADAATVDDIPDDFAPRPLGARADLIAKILEVVPEADFTNPAWGVLDGPGYAIEFNIRADPVQGFTLHVHGGGEATGAVAAILGHLGVRGIDCTDTTFFDRASAQASFVRWQEYRDRAIGTTRAT